VIFRENTEDNFAGIEYAPARRNRKDPRFFSRKNFQKSSTRSLRHTRKGSRVLETSGAPEKSDVMVGIGVKPVSRSGSVRLIHSAIVTRS